MPGLAVLEREVLKPFFFCSKSSIIQSKAKEKNYFSKHLFQNKLNVPTMSDIQPSTMKVTINACNSISFWTWTGDDDDVCAICQNPLDGCAEGAEFPGDESPVVWGDCQHAFHLRCLQRWLQTNNSCPICRRDWNFASDNNGENAAANPEAVAAAAADAEAAAAAEAVVAAAEAGGQDA